MTSEESLKRYLPEEVPNHLFTNNKLKQMGLKAVSASDAFVKYPEQKREYRLYDINHTQSVNKQNKGGLSITTTDSNVNDVLKQREHELKIRNQQLNK